MSKKQKNKSRISKAQSSYLCKFFEKCDGKWEKILCDKEIKSWGKTDEYLKQHVNNKKKKIKKAIGGTRSSKGEKRREKILLKLGEEEDEKESSDSSGFHASSGSDEDDTEEEFEIQDITKRRFNQKNDIYEWLTTYSDGETRWVNVESFVDSDGKCTEKFNLFEEKNPYPLDEEQRKETLKRFIQDKKNNSISKKTQVGQGSFTRFYCFVQPHKSTC